MKKFLSLVLALVMAMSLVTVSAGATEYKDFTDKDEIQYVEAVSVLNRLGIITGYSEGDFRPEGELTRGAAAKIIVSLLIGPEAAEALGNNSSPFPDVPAGNNFAGVIGYCKTAKIIGGYSDGTFRPQGTLTGYAFAKMLLGALGYKTEHEGFEGAGWNMNVARLGGEAGLFNRISFNGNEPVNREQACQLALNTLKGTMVEYSGGMNITTGDATIVASPTRNYKVSNQEYARHINNRKAVMGNLEDDYWTVEFGEEHFVDLRMDTERTNWDNFGRPSNVWSYKKVTIGTYPVEVDFDYDYQVIHATRVEGTTDASKVRALGLNGYTTESDSGDKSNLWINGYLAGDVDKVADIADYTDNGTLVEVYVSDTEADYITDVVVIKTQLMEIKRIGSDYVSLDLYDDKSDAKDQEKDVALFGYNQPPIDKKVNDVEVDDDCYEQLKAMKAGDIVAVVPVCPDENKDEDLYDVARVYAPETVSGNLGRVETYGTAAEGSNAIGVTVGGTAYKIALWNKDLFDIDGDTVKNTKKDVTLYLDEYGNALLAKDVGGTSNWMVIKNYRQGLVNGVLVNYVNGWDIGGEELTLNVGTRDYEGKNGYVPGTLVRYESDADSNTAEWKLSDANADGVFEVALDRTKDVNDRFDLPAAANQYSIKASNTAIKLSNFDATVAASKPGYVGGNTATIDSGVKFIYISLDTDKEVDSIEFNNGVKDADYDEIYNKGDVAQACVSLKDDKDAGLKDKVLDNSAVKAVVIKRESSDASVNNLLYISNYDGSATRYDANGDIVYGYKAIMMGAGGKLVDDDVTIYSYKNLKIGQWARYSKATAPEGVSGVNADNFYDLRGYGTADHADTFTRSAAVMTTAIYRCLSANKYLVETDRRYSGTATTPNIASDWASIEDLNLGDGKAAHVLNLRGAEWVDLRTTKDKIDDIDALKEIVNADTGAKNVRVTVLFNDNTDSDDFRHVYLVIIEGTATHDQGAGGVTPPETKGNVTIEGPEGSWASADYNKDKEYAAGDTFELTVAGGYKVSAKENVTIEGTTVTVDAVPAKITIVEDKPVDGVTDYDDHNAEQGVTVQNTGINTADFSITPKFDVLTRSSIVWKDTDGTEYKNWVPSNATPTITYDVYGLFGEDYELLASNQTASKKTGDTLQTATGVKIEDDRIGKEITSFKVDVTKVEWDKVGIVFADPINVPDGLDAGKIVATAYDNGATKSPINSLTVATVNALSANGVIFNVAVDVKADTAANAGYVTGGSLDVSVAGHKAGSKAATSANGSDVTDATNKYATVSVTAAAGTDTKTELDGTRPVVVTVDAAGLTTFVPEYTVEVADALASGGAGVDLNSINSSVTSNTVHADVNNATVGPNGSTTVTLRLGSAIAKDAPALRVTLKDKTNPDKYVVTIDTVNDNATQVFSSVLTGISDNIELEITGVETLAGPKLSTIEVVHAAANTWAAGTKITLHFENAVLAPADESGAAGGNETNGIPTSAASSVSPSSGTATKQITYTMAAKSGTGLDDDIITFAAGTFVDAVTGICNDKPIVLAVSGASVTIQSK